MEQEKDSFFDDENKMLKLDPKRKEFEMGSFEIRLKLKGNNEKIQNLWNFWTAMGLYREAIWGVRLKLFEVKAVEAENTVEQPNVEGVKWKDYVEMYKIW